MTGNDIGEIPMLTPPPLNQKMATFPAINGRNFAIFAENAAFS